ncbi:glycosyltransferase family protein [Mammaliicoccus sp. I-M36]|uniref:glycosyltransferase family protein n=1 Tax=Mammaliicoccus sp. I-M36 TaxID=2898695 RepID=UPI001EFBDC7B|nr:glycosyltransferase family protein [Mammaliicoccus sp. I-M36]
MKILIGVCGIGLGHSTRQYELAKELVKKGHCVRVITFLNGCNYFKERKIKYYDVWVPIIRYKKGKLDYINLIRDNYKSILSGCKKNYKVKKIIEDEFIPDLCITDYEPFTAKIAYKYKTKLILVDQQSKFWKSDFENIGDYSPEEEKKRMSLFFPKYDRSFITSFYKIANINDIKTEVVSPIIKEEIRNFKNEYTEKRIIVYFSRYVNQSIDQNWNDLLKIFSIFKEYTFEIFTNSSIKCDEKISNIRIHSFSNEKFNSILLNSKAVISTAGHTLISEALYLRKPLYIIPIGTFDQHFCAEFIKKELIGYSSKKITLHELKMFINNIEKYKNNINNNEKLLLKNDSLKKIIDYIENSK